MNTRRMSAVVLSVALFGLAQAASAQAPAKNEIKGAAILEHPCGKVAVKHMGLVHAGKMEEATRLGTPEMQKAWKALPDDERKMMSGMMKEMSKTEAEFSAEIKEHGVLVVDGKNATLTITKEHKDANGSGTETMEQRFEIDGATCQITR